MKQVQAYQDNAGKLHLTEAECSAANAALQLACEYAVLMRFIKLRFHPIWEPSADVGRVVRNVS